MSTGGIILIIFLVIGVLLAFVPKKKRERYESAPWARDRWLDNPIRSRFDNRLTKR